MSKASGSWAPEDNPVIVRFVGATFALFAAFGWRPPTDWKNTAVDVLGLALTAYLAVEARSKVTPVA